MKRSRTMLKNSILFFLLSSLAQGPLMADSPWKDDRPLKIGELKVLTADPQAGHVLEVSFDLSATYANPFDPREIEVNGRLSQPGGQESLQPAFFFVPFERSSDRTGCDQDGGPSWRLRF